MAGNSQALSLTKLVEAFASLPGIGMKSAQRLAYYVLKQPDSQVEAFAQALLNDYTIKDADAGFDDPSVLEDDNSGSAAPASDEVDF